MTVPAPWSQVRTRRVATVLLAAFVVTLLAPWRLGTAYAADAVTLNVTSGLSGSTITVTGIGFAPNPSLTITWDATPLTTVDTLAGLWTKVITPPPSASGAHTVGAGTATATFTVNSSFTILPNIGAAATLVTVSGLGYASSQTGISITFNGSQVTTGAANTVGSFSASFGIPPGPSGSFAVGVAPAPALTFTVISGLSLSPATGPPGSTVNVTGSGSTPTTLVNITFDGTVSRSTSSDSTGSFSTTLLIPPAPGGSHLVSFSGASGPAVGFNLTPSLRLDKSAAPPGGGVTVSGAGFAPSEGNITVTFDGSLIASGITADPAGSWTSTFAVPAAGSGSHTVKASGSLTPGSAVPQASLSVAAGIRLDKTNGAPGTVVKVTGFGYTPNVVITVTAGTAAPVTTTATSDGAWTANLTIPLAPSGPLTVLATGTGSQTAGTPFSVSPALSVSPSSASPGASVTVKGSGFAESQGDITVALGAAVKVVLSDNAGSWTATLTVPFAPGGIYSLRSGGTAPEVATTFTINPMVSLSPSQGSPGTRVTVTGSGFGANLKGVSIAFAQSGAVISTDANADGSWNATLIVPSSASGAYSIRSGGSGPVLDAAFTVTPSINLSMDRAAPGAPLTVTGAGFSANERGISIQLGSATLASGIAADAQGAWTRTFPAPSLPANSYTLAASGLVSAATSVRGDTLSISAGLSTSPAKGKPGTTIRVAGSGFRAGEADIVLSYNGNAVVSGITADNGGAFNAAFALPPSTGGPHQLKAASTDASTTAVVNVEVTPDLVLGHLTGPPGRPVAVSGSGFGGEETGIIITFDGMPVLRGVRADARGSFAASLQPPVAAAGSHSVQASSSSATGASPPEQAFTITPAVSLSATGGNIGMGLTVSGRGFGASSMVTVLYDSGSARVTSDADANGSFRANITIPKSLYGDHQITVTDGSGNEARASFAVDSTPPVVPKLLVPNGTGGAVFSGYQPTLTWSSSDDPSGATYTLQLDRKPDFANPILVKSGLATPSYALAAEEKLARGTYYWRVKATDAASNEGPWSDPYTIRSGTLSLWIPPAISLLVLIAVGTLGYLVVKRRRQRRVTPVFVPGGFRDIQEPTNARQLPPGSRPALDIPSRLALPPPTTPRGGRGRSLDDIAQFQRVLDFVRSLPLPRVASDLAWLKEMLDAEEVTRQRPEEAVSGQVVLHYQPAWTRHPTYADMQQALQGQPFLQGLDDYMRAMDLCAADALALLRNIQEDLGPSLPAHFPAHQRWQLTFAAGQDALSWFQGTFLREPSARDYTIATASDGTASLGGADDTPFGATLASGLGQGEAATLRNAHLGLRATYRGSDQARDVAAKLTQTTVLRERLVQAIASLGQGR